MVLLVREGRGGSGLSDSQLHCTSPLGCARLRPASARLSRPASAHLSPPLLPSIFLRLVSLVKQNPGADAPRISREGLFPVKNGTPLEKFRAPFTPMPISDLFLLPPRGGGAGLSSIESRGRLGGRARARGASGGKAAAADQEAGHGSLHAP